MLILLEHFQDSFKMFFRFFSYFVIVCLFDFVQNLPPVTAAYFSVVQNTFNFIVIIVKENNSINAGLGQIEIQNLGRARSGI